MCADLKINIKRPNEEKTLDTFHLVSFGVFHCTVFAKGEHYQNKFECILNAVSVKNDGRKVDTANVNDVPMKTIMEGMI